jgi:hypothetical protein
MLLVENVPQPKGLIVNGDASAPESRMQMGISPHLPRGGMTAGRNRRPELLFKI